MANSLSLQGHTSGQPSWRQKGDALGKLEPWHALLPAAWRDAAEPPLYFERFDEYEVEATRTVGYDPDDQPCYVAYSYVLTRLCCDDDEHFYEAVSYCEQGAAWRLRDQRWLVFRRVDTGQGNIPRGFYSFSNEIPR